MLQERGFSAADWAEYGDLFSAIYNKINTLIFYIDPINIRKTEIAYFNYFAHLSLPFNLIHN